MLSQFHIVNFKKYIVFGKKFNISIIKKNIFIGNFLEKIKKQLNFSFFFVFLATNLKFLEKITSFISIGFFLTTK